MMRELLIRTVNRQISVRSIIHPACTVRYQSSAPTTILDKSLWQSLVPKPLRKENRQKEGKKSKEWNPATFYIIMFLLIGSTSIQMIAFRNFHARYMRQAEPKIAQLKEVIGKIQRKEEVDVEKILGTGNPQKEAEWEEVLKQIERETIKPNQKPKWSRKKRQVETEADGSSPTGQAPQAQSTTQATEKPTSYGSFF